MRRDSFALSVFFGATIAALAVEACSSGGGTRPGATGGAGTGGKSSSSSHAATVGTANGGGVVIATSSGSGMDTADSGDADTGIVTNPCGTQCGPKELCDEAHIGLDDNCNGEVDEGCSCPPGEVHWCFAGDPAYHNAPGCHDGVETCSELGIWGPCIGGVQAIPPDNCQLNNVSACHAITSPPYATVDLETGTGTYSADAVPGSETFSVTCPMGVSQCPTPTGSSYTAIQSGEYLVTYSKLVAGDPNVQSCSFPLFVGAPGLRVELTWEHSLEDMGVDLDLHMHQPVSMDPWAVNPGQPQDCGWASCREINFQPPQPVASPNWFPSANAPPMPCNWDLQTVMADNTCYNDPRGVGPLWQSLGMGCHNPRLDIDNIQCDYSITDPTNAQFCAPENINVDYPTPSQWVRIATHYYYNHGLNYDVHPEIKVYCNGSLWADLGPHQFYTPEAPVTFEPADGAGMGEGNRFWIAADVALTTSSCGVVSCIVKPVYSDATQKTPFFTIDTAAEATFAPAWPPAP